MSSRRSALAVLGSGIGLTLLAGVGRALGLARRADSRTSAEAGEAAESGESAATAGGTAPLVGGMARKESAMKVHYLEIVTPEVEAACAAYAEMHGVAFSEPQADLGNARTAPLQGGGLLGVRAAMAASETPVVRPYMLVEDIEAAVRTAVAAGAEIAHPPLEIPGRGQFAIYIMGGIQHALWQV